MTRDPSPSTRARQQNLGWLVSTLGSVAALARGAGVSRSRLTEVLGGSACTPTMARRIERSLGLEPLWLDIPRPKVEHVMRDQQAMRALQQFLPETHGSHP